MARIRVVTDSACDLSPAMAEEHGIVVVPLTIRFGSEEFTDGSAIPPDEFWARCATSPVLPETSAPAPGAFQAAFLAAADDGCDGVVCITLSSGVSATYQAARTAADLVADRIPVRVVDTQRVTMGQGLMVLDAAELAATGATLDEVVARVEDMMPRTTSCGVVDTPGAPREGRPHRRRPGPARLAAVDQARGHRPQRRRGGGVQAADPVHGRCRYLANKAIEAGAARAAWRCATGRPPTSTSSSTCWPT